MNTSNESNKSDLLNIPVLSSRWKALAIATALLTVFVHYSRISADKAPDWLANLPAIGATGYVALMAITSYWFVIFIGRWVMRLIARGTKVEAFCRPDYMWAFLLALLISVLDAVTLLVIEINTDQVGAFMGVCLTFFSALLLLNGVGVWGWLTAKPIFNADFWRTLAAIFVGLSVVILMLLPAVSSSFHSWAIDAPLLVGSLVGTLVTSVAHILYANSAAFCRPSGGEVDRALSNFNYATTDQDFRIGKYI
jgi:hypothetical protein